jgi:hypothetical protein
VSIDGQLAQELTYAERAIWKKRAYEIGLPMLFDHEIQSVRREGNRLVATFRNLMTDQPLAITTDQVVVEHGTIPASEVYEELKAGSVNDGVTDLDALLATQPQPLRSGGGRYELYRVGDAVASRNIHVTGPNPGGGRGATWRSRP